jgi:hypothetical protein
MKMTITINNTTFECDKAADIRKLLAAQAKVERDRVDDRATYNVRNGGPKNAKPSTEWARELGTTPAMVAKHMREANPKIVTRTFAEVLPDGTIDQGSTIKVTRKINMYY